MSETFHETLEKLNRALERNRRLDRINREIASLSIRGMECQFRGDMDALNDIANELEILRDELKIIGQ